MIITYTSSQKTTKFSFISDYNFHFLTDDDFLAVERKLETCQEIHDNLISAGNYSQEKFFQECDKVFGTSNILFEDYDPNNAQTKNIICRINSDHVFSTEYQQIINYLVYIESFMPLIERRLIKIYEVDDTFGYRFFTAMNNPVIQENELVPIQQYYPASVRVYKKWKKYRTKRRIPIPLMEFDLEQRLRKVHNN